MTDEDGYDLFYGMASTHMDDELSERGQKAVDIWNKILELSWDKKQEVIKKSIENDSYSDIMKEIKEEHELDNWLNHKIMYEYMMDYVRREGK